MRILTLTLLAGMVTVSAAQAAQTRTQQTTTNTATGDSTVVTTSPVDGSMEPDSVTKTEIDRVHVQQQPGMVAPDQQPQANTGTAVERTEIREQQVTPSSFRNEALGIKLQLGMVDTGSITPRGAVGLTFDINFLRRLQTLSEGKPYFGLSFGAIYSHLGFDGSDFFGMNGGTGSNNGTHLLQLPVNLKAGYTFGDIFRPSVHGGLNVVYLSNQGGGAMFPSEASAWNTHPNLGADLEFGIGKSVAVLLRPDWTFLTNDTLFTGTLGISFPIS